MFENKVQNMFLFMCVTKCYQIIHIQDGLIIEVFIIWVLANLKLCRETKSSEYYWLRSLNNYKISTHFKFSFFAPNS